MADVTGPLPQATVGEDYSTVILLQQGGANIDLTTMTAAEFNVAASLGGAILLTASLANGQLTLGGTAGTVSPSFSNQQLSQVADGNYVYEVKITDDSSPAIISKPVGGPFIIAKTVKT